MSVRRRLLALAAALWLLAPGARAETTPLVQGVEAVGMTVADLDRSVRFYVDVLSFSLEGETDIAGEAYERLTGVFGMRARVARLRLGREAIELTQYLTPEGRPIGTDWRNNDRWFQHVAIIVSDMDTAYGVLRAHKVRHSSSGPQRLPDWNAAAGGIRAFYFKDPDGHPLEILQFPPDKGDPKWHAASGKLFLGIDHTAIVVADTAASLAFYEGALGLSVAGHAENWGPEQEHLNGVFGAHLRITTLRAAHGPGIELLEYLAPSDGRPMPTATHANDLWHETVTLRVGDAEAASAALSRAHGRLVSPTAVVLPDHALGIDLGALARDPDGHAVLFAAAGQPSLASDKGEEGRGTAR
jgi:catechol 2,3-dioxygenase-like lactoylglutathione lyase family enzyme